jgi:hypothetical protein
MTEQTELASNNVQPPPFKKKVCKLVWAQLWCIAALIFLSIPLKGLLIGEHSEYLIPPLTSLLAIIFIGIAALIRISLKSEQLKGRIGCLLMMAVSGFFIYATAYSEVPRAKKWHYANCGTNLKGLGTALKVYAYDYNGHLPESNWCDRLVEEADVSPKSLTCPQSDSIIWECDFCLNQHAAGKNMEALPDDMVVLFDAVFVPEKNEKRQAIRKRSNFDKLTPLMRDMFEGDEEVYLTRWNQVGGPEMLDYKRHEGGCYVLLADGSSNWVTHAELPSLRWDIEGKVKLKIPEAEIAAAQKKLTVFLSFKKGLMNTLLLLSALATIVVVIRFGAVRYLVFIAGLGVLSAATGWVFGGWSEAAYVEDGTQGPIAGAVFGLLVGLCFAAVMTGMLEQMSRIKAIVLLYTAWGTVTGVVCSMLVHLTLMIFHTESNAWGIVIGIPYGLFAGAVLGFMSGVAVKTIYMRKAASKLGLIKAGEPS